MRNALSAVLLSLSLVTAALAQQTVSVDYDKTFDFSKLKTFAVQLGQSSGNPLADKRVMADVTEALTGKGWTAADASTANAIVVLNMATETKHTLQAMGMGGLRFGGMGSASIQDYQVGTLLVDINDAKSQQLVFRGTASDQLSSNPDKNQAKVEKATAKMFKNFPPSPGK